MKTLYFIVLVVIFSSFTSEVQEFEYIKIINLKRKPIVEGTINGKVAYFLLDTGSDLTIINSKDAEIFKFKMYLKTYGNKKVASFGGVHTDLYNTLNADLYLGTQKMKAEIFCYDLTNIIESLNSHSKIKISGIIGSNIMKAYGFSINYNTQEVAIKLMDKKQVAKR